MPIDASSDPYDVSRGPDHDLDPKSFADPAHAVHPDAPDAAADPGTKAAGLGALPHDDGPDGKFGHVDAGRGVDLAGTEKAAHLADLDHAGSGAKFDPAAFHDDAAPTSAHGVDLDAAGTGASAKTIAALHDLGGDEHHVDKHLPVGSELHGHDLDGLNALKASVGVDALHDDAHGAHGHGDLAHDDLHHGHDDHGLHGHGHDHDVAHHDDHGAAHHDHHDLL